MKLFHCPLPRCCSDNLVFALDAHRVPTISAIHCRHLSLLGLLHYVTFLPSADTASCALGKQHSAIAFQCQQRIMMYQTWKIHIRHKWYDQHAKQNDQGQNDQSSRLCDLFAGCECMPRTQWFSIAIIVSFSASVLAMFLSSSFKHPALSAARSRSSSNLSQWKQKKKSENLPCSRHDDVKQPRSLPFATTVKCPYSLPQLHAQRIHFLQFPSGRKKMEKPHELTTRRIHWEKRSCSLNKHNREQPFNEIKTQHMNVNTSWLKS